MTTPVDMAFQSVLTGNAVADAEFVLGIPDYAQLDFSAAEVVAHLSLLGVHDPSVSNLRETFQFAVDSFHNGTTPIADFRVFLAGAIRAQSRLYERAMQLSGKRRFASLSEVAQFLRPEIAEKMLGRSKTTPQVHVTATVSSPPPSVTRKEDTKSAPVMLAAGLSMGMRMLPSVGQVLELQPQLQDTFYGAVLLWEHTTHQIVQFRIGGEVKEVPFALVPQEWLENLVPGERFGAYFGDMMFISAGIAREHADWVPFVIAKLYGERFVDDGLDPTGITKHYESLFRTIRMANAIMDTEVLWHFLDALMRHERTGYLEFDEEARRFLEGHPNLSSARAAYLAHHHDNRWVRKGRLDEEFAVLGADSGFRNHAEVVAQRVLSMGPSFLYPAAQFIHDMPMHLSPVF